MNTMEIVLLIAGALVFIISFILPAGKQAETEGTKELVREEFKKLTSKELDQMKEHVKDVVDEAVQYSMEKTERSLERLSNEKITAVSEYSDTVLAEINKNHKEVMFLYDMLNEKHDNIRSTVSEAEITMKTIASAVKDMEAMSRDVKKEAEEAIVSLRAANVSGGAASSGVVKTPGGVTSPGAVNALGGGISFGVVQSEVPSGLAETDLYGKPVEESVSQDGFQSLQAKSVEAGSQRVVEALSPARSREIPNMDISFIQENENGANSNERIMELYRQGKSKIAIAKELGLGVGEVKLVIDLYKGM